MKKNQTPTRKKLLSSVKMKPERSVLSIKMLFETGLSCRNEDDQSNLERRKPLEKTKTVVVAVVDNTDVVTKPEAEDVIVEMKKKTTVRKLEEAEMQMKKLMKKKKEVEKMKMKTGNLCEVKLVDESIIPEGRSQRNMSKLTPKLFSIF